MEFFIGLTFAIFGFGDSDRMTLEQFITEFGGILYNDKNPKIDRKVDYNILPLNGAITSINAIHNVTYYWLVGLFRQSCIDDKKVHDTSSHVLYTPIPFDINIKQLKDCVVGISQYENPERETVVNLAELLGAKHQDRLSKENRPNQGLVANTHLIANQPNGKKYDGAIAWGIPVVPLLWLVDCAKAGKKLNEEAYLIGSSKILNTSKTLKQNSFLTSTPKQSFNNISDFPKVSILDKSEPLPKDSQTPNKDVYKTPIAVRNNSMTDEEIKRIKERIANGYKTPMSFSAAFQRLKADDILSNKSLSYCATPITTPFKTVPKVNVREAMAKYDSPIEGMSSTKVSLEDKTRLFCGGVRKGLEEHIEQFGSIIPDRKLSIGYFEGKDALKPLKGLVIAVSKKLRDYQGELNKLAENLGAKCRWTFDKKATHLIFEEYTGGPVPKELRDAQAEGKFIVSREWLYACRDQNKRAQESNYPYTYNPRKALDFTELYKKSDSRSIVNERSKSPLKEATSSRSLDCEINKLKEATEDYKRHRPTKTAVNFNMSPNFFKEGIKKPPPRKDTDAEIEQALYFESVPITWDKPVCQPSVSASASKSSGDIDTSNIKPTPKILVSGLTSKEKHDYSMLVKRLGGEMKTDRDFDPNFTHLVTTSANYTEKFIASVARGLWVLNKSYLEACSLEGRFVDEEEHELGRCPSIMGEPGSKEYQLSIAARRWRIKASTMKESRTEPYGAFCNWKVIIYTNETRTSSFTRILSAGGAQIVSARPPFSNIEGVTHAFLELSNVDDTDIDFAHLIQNTVLCLKFEYITSYLFEEDNAEDFYISEIKDYLQNNRSSSEKRSSDNEPDISNSKRLRNNFEERR
ncbi:DNA topoisomerase 2-binding protein 1 [Chamberlinius hualienensis]